MTFKKSVLSRKFESSTRDASQFKDMIDDISFQTVVLKSRSPQPFGLAHVRSRDVRQKRCRLEDVKMCVHDPLALLQNEALLRPRLKDAGLRFSSASFHRSKVHNSLLKSCGTLPIHAENFVIRTERKRRRM